MNTSVTIEQARARQERFDSVYGPFHTMSYASKFAVREVAIDETVPVGPVKSDESQDSSRRDEAEREAA